MDLVPADLERHVDEVADVVEVVAREDVRQAAAVAEDPRGDRRELRDQSHTLEAAALLVADLLRVGIERRERGGRAEQHPHRVRVVAEAVEELHDVLVDVRVQANLLLPRVQLGLRGQLALEQERHDLEETRLLGELLDRIAAVAQDPGVAVDVRDRAAGRRGVEESRVV